MGSWQSANHKSHAQHWARGKERWRELGNNFPSVPFGQDPGFCSGFKQKAPTPKATTQTRHIRHYQSSRNLQVAFQLRQPFRLSEPVADFIIQRFRQEAATKRATTKRPSEIRMPFKTARRSPSYPATSCGLTCCWNEPPSELARPAFLDACLCGNPGLDNLAKQ